MTMRLDLLTLIVVAANVLGSVMALPQAIAIVRTRNTLGVSPTWVAISMAINVWWAAYGLGIGDRAIIPVAVVSFAAYSVIAVALARCSPSTIRASAGGVIAATAGVTVAPLLALVAGGWSAAGITLGALYAAQLTPAVVTVYRAHDVSGVSAATWMIAWTEALLWGAYGIPKLDAGLITLSATGVVMASLVLVRLFLRRPRGVTGMGTVPLSASV
jgi:uncharacterized protein with PQ loop repeat